MGADAEVISFREECVTELRPGRPAPKKRERLPPLSKQDRIARKAVAQKYAYGDAITRKVRHDGRVTGPAIVYEPSGL